MTRPNLPPGLLRLERLLTVLPRTESLNPLSARLLGSSRADEGRRWTASGELGTAAGRIVDVQDFRVQAEAWVAEECARLERRAGAVAATAEALTAGDGHGVVEALLAESGALEADGAPTEAETWADAAFRFAQGVGAPRAAEARRRMARCARARGDLEAAARGYEDAWSRARDAGCWNDAVVAATGRGNVAVDRGGWVEAELWYTRAMDILHGPDHRMDESTERALHWRLCQNMGITHRERGDLEGSEGWYRSAEEGSRGLDDSLAVIEIANGRGQLAISRGDPEAAETHFRRALAAMTGSRPDAVRVAIRSNLAEALMIRGRTLEAGLEARKAEAEAIRGRHVGRLPEVYRVLARILAARGGEEAFVLVERALELVRREGLPAVEEARTLETYAELRHAEGEEELAAEAQARALEILRGLKDQAPESGGDDVYSPDGGAS